MYSSTDPFGPVWSGFSDSSLRPTLLIARDGSGYRPVLVSELNASVSISGLTVAVDAVGISGSNGATLDVISIGGVNGLAVTMPSGVQTQPDLPISHGVYGIDLTGVGVFSNYASVSPLASGANVTILSVEPDSSNSRPVWYAFSGTASTGQAWEMRGDRTFELASNRVLFFAQATGNQRVMVHFQTY